MTKEQITPLPASKVPKQNFMPYAMSVIRSGKDDAVFPSGRR